MKKLILIFFISNIYSNFVYSQSGWFWQNPFPIGYDLNSIFDAGNNVLYSCGFNGAIIKSTNSGLNWEVKHTGTLEDFLDCYFINENTGYLVGTKILKTTNGGDNWEIQFSYDFFKSCSFYNNNIGLAVGYSGTIYKTSNGGDEWLPTNNTGITSYFIKVDCIDSITFVVASDGDKILRSTNFGDNWEIISLGIYEEISTMDILNSNFGLIISKNQDVNPSRQRYWKTTNSGINWVLISERPIFTYKKNLQLVNENTGYLIDDFRSIYRTTNAGLEWSEFNTGTTVDLYGLNFSFSNEGYLVGSNGEMLKSSNAGINWYNLNYRVTGNVLSRVFFTGNNLGYIVGDNGIVLKSVNGGSNWFNLTFPSGSSLKGLYFINGNTGFVGGLSNMNIYKTTDGGNTWQPKSTGSNAIYSIFFVDQNIGFACGYPPIISKTTNGGENWISKFPGGNSDLLEIKFTSVNTGYVVSATGSVFKTTNSGENWMEIGQGFDYLWSVDFVSDDTGFISSANGKIYKTYNGGLNWIQKNTGETNQLNSIDFLNPNTGYAVGYKIIKTTNGGDNWITINLFGHGVDVLWSIEFLDSNIGYVVGSHGAILKTTDGGGSIVNLESNINEIPINISLHQNFPNPFNPVTKIKFEISMLSSVKLIVFDILGKEVNVLIDKTLLPGNYESAWDGTNFPSGIYFYRIETEDFIETKKMVLTK